MKLEVWELKGEGSVLHMDITNGWLLNIFVVNKLLQFQFIYHCFVILAWDHCLRVTGTSLSICSGIDGDLAYFLVSMVLQELQVTLCYLHVFVVCFVFLLGYLVNLGEWSKRISLIENTKCVGIYIDYPTACVSLKIVLSEVWWYFPASHSETIANLHLGIRVWLVPLLQI